MASRKLFAAQLKPAGADEDLPDCFLQLVRSRCGHGRVCRVQHSWSPTSSTMVTIYQPAQPAL